MKVVAENSREELARRSAQAEVRSALRALASNLMRVARGSGDPTRIFKQAITLVDAYKTYYEATGELPNSYDVHEAISVSEDIRTDLGETYYDRRFALDLIVTGSLQVAASRLVSQKLQESAGDRDIHFGIRELERARAKISQEAARKSSRSRARGQKRGRAS